MRRSAAPSQINCNSGGVAIKKAKFSSPSVLSDNFSSSNSSAKQMSFPNILSPKTSHFFENDTVTASTDLIHSGERFQAERRQQECTKSDISAIKMLIRTPLKNVNTYADQETEVTSLSIQPTKQESDLYVPFKPDVLTQVSGHHDNKYSRAETISKVEQKTTNHQVPDLVSTVTPGSKYYQVVWCKLSKKKHKKWEGDAVLVVSGRSVTLYDMEGKVIGRGSGYKVTQLESLTESNLLVVAGKEVEILSVLKENDFKSGKCFSAASSDTSPSLTSSSSQSVVTKGTPKPFISPLLKSSNSVQQMMKDVPDKQLAVPKYDPNFPGALVMPRPSPEYQWKHNLQSHPVVDVVVDPYLSTSLRTHQREGVIFLYECVMGMRNFQGHGAILADDMGLGKTLQCISLIWTLLKQGPFGGRPIVKKVLIVTPGSLVKNWLLEFKKWLGIERLNVFAVSGDRKAEEFVKSNMYPVLVISYEMFVRCCDLLDDVKFDLIICDEGHRLKNTAAKTTALMMRLPCKKRVVLTGTPVQNDLQEFYSIVQFCNPSLLGTTASFRRIYEEPIVSSRQPEATFEQQQLGSERAQELTRLTQMFVLRRTQEVNNDYLPPKVELVLFCQPSPLQVILYKHLLHSQLIRRCLTGNLSGSPHLACISALKQLCNHPSLLYHKAVEAEMKSRDADGEEVSIFDGLLSYFPDNMHYKSFSCIDSGKMVVLSGLLAAIWRHSCTEKVVLVSNHTKTLDFLQIFCDAYGYKYLRLDGSTPTSHRQDIVSTFNNKYSQQRIFLLSSKAGGVGLNLIGASRLILYDIDWNPANDIQAMARVWRDGQKGRVYIYRLLTTGTIEEKVYQRQITKQGLSGAVMDVNNKNNVQFSLEDLKDLFSLNEMTDCETHSKLGCHCDGNPGYVHVPKENDDEEEIERECQLGRSSGAQKVKTNLTMGELLQWYHWKGEYAGDKSSWYLDDVGHTVSFLFWHQTSAENI
ncbi:DNA repair and recombination protein rad54b [Bulinus truncatus]|nr:DNA repair and recombination protein rad54b [Bulinus truncatus]